MNHIDRIEQLRADLARATAELEHHKSVKETIDSAHKELSREHAALRASVAELEKEREHAQQCVKFHSENSVARHARAEQAEQRNAELVAALRGALGWLEKGGVRSAHVALAHALARAESATPLPMREDPRYRGTDFRSALDVNRASHGGGK